MITLRDGIITSNTMRYHLPFRINREHFLRSPRQPGHLKERAIIRNVGIETRFNQAQKGSFTAQLNFIVINYNASTNTSLAFEMLEGLKTGNNFTWGLSYQRKVAKNLQLNFNYTGRKSEANKPVHAGGMELRAFF